MHGRSAASLESLLEATGTAVDGGADGLRLGADLFGIAQALDGQGSLRRALTEPWIDPDAQSNLMRSLFEGKVTDETLDLAELAARSRWSAAADLGDALETTSVTAYVAQADRDGHLDDVEDDLFRFARILDREPALREVLSDPASPLEGKRALLESLLEGKVGAPTRRLLDQAVSGRHRSVAVVLEDYQKIAAARRHKLVATAWVAADIDDQHRDRLAEALSKQYDRAVHLNVIVDPSVLGGVRVAIGDEVIDSTVQTRLAQARRRLDH
jgi:F-type H+-transporting ATPase subunit delta